MNQEKQGQITMSDLRRELPKKDKPKLSNQKSKKK
jgi:hypothetical protein